MPASDPGPRSRAPQGAQSAWLTIDVVFENDDWPEPAQAEALIRHAATALASHADMSGLAASEACVALSSDAHVKTLNAGFRGQDKPTNVLSFPAANQPGSPPVRLLGDVVIARETVAREAAERGISFADHLRHLTIHGLLHLLGYDHETDEEAVIMERLETDILASIDIADPYGDRDDDAFAR